MGAEGRFGGMILIRREIEAGQSPARLGGSFQTSLWAPEVSLTHWSLEEDAVRRCARVLGQVTVEDSLAWVVGGFGGEHGGGGSGGGRRGGVRRRRREGRWRVRGFRREWKSRGRTGHRRCPPCLGWGPGDHHRCLQCLGRGLGGGGRRCHLRRHRLRRLPYRADGGPGRGPHPRRNRTRGRRWDRRGPGCRGRSPFQRRR